jgi:hypothetical protein
MLETYIEVTLPSLTVFRDAFIAQPIGNESIEATSWLPCHTAATPTAMLATSPTTFALKTLRTTAGIDADGGDAEIRHTHVVPFSVPPTTTSGRHILPPSAKAIAVALVPPSAPTPTGTCQTRSAFSSATDASSTNVMVGGLDREASTRGTAATRSLPCTTVDTTASMSVSVTPPPIFTVSPSFKQPRQLSMVRCYDTCVIIFGNH